MPRVKTADSVHLYYEEAACLGGSFFLKHTVSAAALFEMPRAENRRCLAHRPPAP